MVDSKKGKIKLGLKRGSFQPAIDSEKKRKLVPKKKKDDEAKEIDYDRDFVVDTKNEQLLLGQMLNSKVCLSTYLENCNHDEFLVPNHKVIAFCIEQASHENVQLTDDIFDVYRYEFPGDEKSTGGLAYIAKLRKVYNEDLTPNSYMVHVKKFKSDFIKSEVQTKFVNDYLKLAADPSSSIDQIVEIQSKLESLINEVDTDSRAGFKNMAEANKLHDEELERRKNSREGTSGFRFLDEHLTNAYAPGEITIAAGRPGMGKSAFVANSMNRLANKKIPSALFALEMSTVSTIDRLNAIDTGVPLTNLIGKRRELTQEDKELEQRAKRKREGKPIFICDDVRKSLAQVKRESKALAEKEGVRVIFIDLFMKLKKMTGTQRKSTADQYTEMLNEIQRVGREIGVHFVLVVQINRGPEARNDKRPMLSDLKDSGGFEEVADLVLLFYREAYYLSKNVEEDFDVDIVEIAIAKQRQGTTGVVKAIFQGETTKITKATDDDIRTFDKMVKAMKGKKKKKNDA